MISKNRVLVKEKFGEDVKRILHTKGISQNKFSKEIGVSAPTLSEYLNLKFSMPLQIFNIISEKVALENAGMYISTMTNNREIHRKLALENENFIKKRNKFKIGEPKTREIAAKAGRIGGIRGGPKVAEILMKQGRGIFSKQHNRSFYGKKGGKTVVAKHLGPFSPDYYKLDKNGCQSNPERITYDHLKKLDNDIISINKNSKYWFKCGERILRLDFYLPTYNIFVEVCGCLGDPRYRDKAERLKLILDNNPNIRIILIVNDMELAMEELKPIIHFKQILELVSLDDIKTVNSRQWKAFEPQIA